MPGDTITVGNVTITAVKDLPAMRGDPNYMWRDNAPERWAAHGRWLNDRGLLDITIGSYLIRSAGKTVVVDTGIGRKEHPVFRTERAALLDNLAAQGVQPEDVDLVLNTHLHVDHVGWNTVEQDGKWVPAFPRARYLIQKGEWEYFTAPERRDSTPYIQDCLLPVYEAGQVDLVDHEHAITPDLTYLPAPGHTPDQVAIFVQSEGERAILTGDVAHHPVQWTETDWLHRADVDAELAIRTRRALAERIEKEGLILAAAHHPFPPMGRLIRIGDRRVFQGIDVPQ